MIDRTTRWPEATIPNVSADTVINAFFNTWVARFAAPNIITTDRDVQFESLIFESMSKTKEAKERSTAYHPQSNRMIER